MSLSAGERQKRFKEKKKLKLLNQELLNNDIIRGEKKTSNRDNILLRENILLTDNEPMVRFKNYMLMLIRKEYQNADNCFMFSLCYPVSNNVGMIKNIDAINALVDEFKEKKYIDSLIIIPEYHKTRSGIHSHGIIKITEEFKGDFNKIIKAYWINKYNGSVHVEALNPTRKFEEYLTKYVIADKRRLYHFCDGLVTVGVDLNAIDESKVYKSRLTPLAKATGDGEKLQVDNNNTINCDDTTINQYSTSVNSHPNLKSKSIWGRCKTLTNRLSKFNVKSEYAKPIMQKAYTFYSMAIIAYINFIMRI